MTRALMIVWSNPSSDAEEDEYNEWYSGQHLTDVIAVPGVVAAQRFKLVNTQAEDGMDWPEHRYLAFYEVEEEDLEAFTEEMNRRDGTELMPISPTLGKGYTVHYWEPITERRTK